MAELEQVTDAVADVAEEVAGEVEQFADAVRNLTAVKIRYAALGAAAGAAAGALVAWQFAYKRAMTKAEKIIEEEIASMRDHFEAKISARENVEAKAAESVRRAEEIVEREGYSQTPETPVPPPVAEPQMPVVEVPAQQKARNVFEAHGPIDTWDLEEERQLRMRLQEGVQYVIHKDEVGETGWDLKTLTYFELDDVLADEQDQVVDQDVVVGLQCMDKFGHGSEDPQVVFVRNPEMNMEYEVIKTPRSFAQEVHGFDPDIRHADQTRLRGRGRFSDDE